MQKLVSSLVYPVSSKSWYTKKGYKSFDEFVESQQGKINGKKVIFSDMKNVSAKRSKVKVALTNGQEATLDSVTLTPNADIDAQNKPGKGKHMIYFFGRNEPYEVKYREMLQDATEAGVTVHAFNLPGMHDSTGAMLEFSDAVNSGVAQVNALLEKGINPDDIILKGNCFGASIASEVQHVASVNGIQIRNINSNSYRNFKTVISEALPKKISKLVNVFLKLLDYTGWNAKTEETTLVQTPYTCVIHRENDKTLRGSSKLQTSIEEFYQTVNGPDTDLDERDLVVEGFEDSQAFLRKHNVMHLKKGAKAKDSHTSKVGDLYWLDETGAKKEFYEFTKEYIVRSNEYVEKHPQQSPKKPIPYAKRSAAIAITSAEKQSFERLHTSVSRTRPSPARSSDARSLG